MQAKVVVFKQNAKPSVLFFVISQTMKLNRYTSYATFLQKHFRHKMQKLPIDAGCTCPVRDGRLSHSGCAFCNACSFVPACSASAINIKEQIERGKKFFQHKHSKVPCGYLAYFQSGTNTYASTNVMLPLIEAALREPNIEGIVLATRPDCISSEWIELLQQLSKQIFVLVELGIESTNDAVLLSMNRGHNTACSMQAVQQLHAAGIYVCAHLIIGLPGETHASTMHQARVMNHLDVDVIKLHQLQYLRGSQLGAAYLQCPSQFHVLQADEYVSTVADFIETLSPSIAIERFVSQSPSSQLIAPRWGLKNDAITRMIEQELKRRATWQGIKQS